MHQHLVRKYTYNTCPRSDYNYNKIVAEADTTTDQGDFDEQEYNDQLTKLNFRLEMEEHAREAMDHLLLPEIPETRDKPDPNSMANTPLFS